MKILLCFAALLIVIPAAADGKPDTFAILKQAKMVYIEKAEDLDTNVVTYRIEFCADQDCDRFEANETKLHELSDYAYLFAVFSGRYDKYYLDLPPSANNPGPIDNPMVSDAKNKGYAQAVMDAYRSQYGCPQGQEEQKCVMHGLFKAGRLKRFNVGYDEGESYDEVSEEHGNTTP